MKPNRQLIDEIRRRRKDQADRLHPIDRALAGAALHDIARERMIIGIRMDMPDADEATVRQVLRERLARQRKRDQKL